MKPKIHESQTAKKEVTMSKPNEIKTEETTVLKGNYLMVSPNLIVADENLNPRFEYGDIEELMNSILENGIRNPLKGYKKGDQIILKDGHRRMRAVNLAITKGHKIERVPVIIELQSLNEEERTLEFLIYNDGKPLTMLEQSEVIKRLLNFGWKITDVVKKTGKARGYIENLIMLTKTSMKVQNFIKEGKISAHTVIQITQAFKGDIDKTTEEVEKAIKIATESGKEKATPKHVTTDKVKVQSYGKFYKWAEEIADKIAGRKDLLKDREEVLSKLLIGFENGQPASQFADTYFIDKTKKSEAPAKKVVPSAPLTPAPIKKKAIVKKAVTATKAKKK
jgi:ParB/RepB/Spo0J family partition protein